MLSAQTYNHGVNYVQFVWYFRYEIFDIHESIVHVKYLKNLEQFEQFGHHKRPPEQKKNHLKSWLFYDHEFTY